ncbi:MAG: kelch repeat-containing protein [Archangium sp.]|nr:kelch repeat-containing protein [Archangium sp.]
MRLLLISLALALALVSAGCGCSTNIVKVEPARLVANPDAVLFPGTYVGETRTAVVGISNQGGETAELDVFIDAPFTTSTSALRLVRGDSQNVSIVFSPGAPQHFAAVLHVGTLAIPVQGTGLEVPQCTASTTCRDVRFDTSLARCVETTSPDDTACETSCVTGSCHDGTCLGALKFCDDSNACTLDACGEASGCSHRDLTCPQPTAACEVPTCDAQTGCGTTTAPDGTLCGVDDCFATTVDVCISGQCVARTRPLTGRCANRWVPTTVPARWTPHLAYDQARQRVVLFGGHSTSNTSLNDTWEWDGRGWTQLLPSHSPEGRESAAMAYDPRRQRTVLFGGWSTQRRVALDDTWEWDGRTWTQAVTQTAPLARAGAAMSFDSARQVILLFGGGGHPANDETWSWDGTRWQLLRPASSPPPRTGHTQAYDSARQRIVLFGGRSVNNTDLNDTWEWDGATWLLRSPVHSPPARSSASMIFDPRNGVVVLHGGHSGPLGSSFGDTWLWDGLDWTPGQGSTTREAAAMAFDVGAERVVLFGGYRSAGPFFSDTMLWDGAAWAQVAPPVAPGERTQSTAMVGTPQQLVLFGGIQYNGGPNNDHWTWDSTRTWTRRAPMAAPSRRGGHTLAWDSVRQRVVLFGGDTTDSSNNNANRILNETWEWDGNTWAQRFPTTAPEKRTAQAMAFDSARNVTVLYGGFAFDDGAFLRETWTWDGTNWTQRSSAATPPCYGPMAFDASRQRAVFFSAYCNNGVFSNETWEWDGAAWSRKTPPTSPPGATGYAMAYDPSRQRVVLSGGVDRNFVSLELTWEWDGTSWLERHPTVAPTGSGVSAYLPTMQKVVFFDGTTQWVFLP